MVSIDEYKKLRPGPKKKPQKQNEGQVVNACMRWLFHHGVYCWRNNTGKLPDKSGRWVSFGCRGSADILGVVNGKFIAVECKAGRNDLSAEQKLWRDRVQEKGGIYILARSTDDLEERAGDFL